MNVWERLKPQVSEHIQELISLGYTFEEIEKSLESKAGWTVAPIFKKIEFHYENARFTLTGLCNMVELITGSDVSFCEKLRLCVVELVADKKTAYLQAKREDLIYNQRVNAG